MKILSVLTLVLTPSISLSFISRSLVRHIYYYNHYNHCNNHFNRYIHTYSSTGISCISGSSSSSSISSGSSISSSISSSSISSSSSSSGSSNTTNNNDNIEYSKKKKVHVLPRIYIPSLLEVNKYNDLDTDTSHYLGTVLRLRDGDMLRVFNPHNGEYLCDVIDADKDKKRRKSSSLLRIFVKEQLRSSLVLSSSSSPNIVLYMAPIKKQRMKILLEKVTELGINDIVPVITQNTEKASVINNNNDNDGSGHYDRVLIESSEQCERLSIPTLHQSLKLEDLLNTTSNESILLVCRERYQGGIPLLSFLNQFPSSSLKFVGLLVGPEGGFTQEEFDIMSKYKGVKFISLGDTVLRAETAAISAISIINAFYLSQ